MHRTVKVGILNSKSAEVNGTKSKSLRAGREMPHRQKKSQARNKSLLDSQFVYIGVLSDDFATVDFREELCYHSRPKKTNSEGLITVVRMQKVQRDFIRSLAPLLPANLQNLVQK